MLHNIIALFLFKKKRKLLGITCNRMNSMQDNKQNVSLNNLFDFMLTFCENKLPIKYTLPYHMKK